MSSDSSRLRARDSDRVDVCAILDAARDDGQLGASEHAARTESAMRASAFAELDRLVADLQIPGDLVRTPVVRGVPGGGPRWWRPVAVIAAAALAGALAGWAGRAADTITAPPVPDLTSGAGLTRLVADMRAEYGSAVVDDLTVYPEYAMFHRSPGDPLRSRWDRYDGDFDGVGSSTSARRPDTPTIDLATLNVPVIARLVAGAVESLKVPGGEVSHLVFRSPTDSDTEPGPYLMIYVDNPAQDTGFMSVALDGEVLDVRPPTK